MRPPSMPFEPVRPSNPLGRSLDGVLLVAACAAVTLGVAAARPVPIEIEMPLQPVSEHVY